MLKKIITVLFICVSVLALAGCNGGQGETAKLLYDEKYYNTNNYDDEEIPEVSIVFHKDGTGEYFSYIYEDRTYEPKIRKFKYVLSDDTVHCFNDDEEKSTWNEWFTVKDGILIRQGTYSYQYISQSYLKKFPNFG